METFSVQFSIYYPSDDYSYPEWRTVQCNARDEIQSLLEKEMRASGDLTPGKYLVIHKTIDEGDKASRVGGG